MRFRPLLLVYRACSAAWRYTSERRQKNRPEQELPAFPVESRSSDNRRLARAELAEVRKPSWQLWFARANRSGSTPLSMDGDSETGTANPALKPSAESPEPSLRALAFEL